MSRKIVAGIDEAGLGPRIGPLVVTLVCFECDDRTNNDSIEKMLSPALSRSAGIADPKIRVDDSKLVFRGTQGMARLEKAVLSICLSGCGGVPTTLGEWLNEISHPKNPDLEECPWYGPAPFSLSLPLAVSLHDISISGALLRSTMKKSGITGFRIRQRVITEPCFNREVARSDNKSELLAESVNTLAREAIRSNSSTRIEIDTDKLGGRAYYTGMILRAFPMMKLETEEEGPGLSTYHLETEGKRVRMRFIRKGDALHTHIALASMLSKYTRELFMELFNRFWRGLMPGIKPTAGYPMDASRFLKDVKSTAQAAGIEPHSFTRTR